MSSGTRPTSATSRVELAVAVAERADEATGVAAVDDLGAGADAPVGAELGHHRLDQLLGAGGEDDDEVTRCQVAVDEVAGAG